MKYKKSWVIVLFVLLFLALWWVTGMLEHKVYDEIYVPAGESSFVAQGDTISAIGVRTEDYDMAEALKDHQVSLVVGMYDAEGNAVWEENLQGNYVEPNGFVIYDDNYSKMLPVKVTPGETYSIYLASQDSSQREMHLKYLSIMIYSGDNNMFLSYLILVLACILFISLSFMTMRRNFKTGSLMLSFISISLIYIMVSPVNSANGYLNGFSDSYHISNIMLGRAQNDKDGSVFISEDALRNIEVTDNAQALHRFYFDDNYGNDELASNDERVVNGEANSLILVNTAGIGYIFYLIPAVGITVARLLNAGWQVIFLAGRLSNLLVISLFLANLLRLLAKYRMEGAGELVMAFLMAPAVIIGCGENSPFAFFAIIILIVSQILCYRSYRAVRHSKRVNRKFMPQNHSISGTFKRNIDWVLIAIVLILFLFSMIVPSMADSFISNLAGTRLKGDAAIRSPFISYMIICTIITALYNVINGNKDKSQKALFAECIMTAFNVISVYAFIVADSN